MPKYRIEALEKFVVRSAELLRQKSVGEMKMGAPGFGFGWAPAISFNGDSSDAIQNAYVTPLIEVKRDGCDERDWDRVRGAVLSVYG